jgi:hypothetical protein
MDASIPLGGLNPFSGERRETLGEMYETLVRFEALVATVYGVVLDATTMPVRDIAVGIMRSNVQPLSWDESNTDGQGNPIEQSEGPLILDVAQKHRWVYSGSMGQHPACEAYGEPGVIDASQIPGVPVGASGPVSIIFHPGEHVSVDWGHDHGRSGNWAVFGFTQPQPHRSSISYPVPLAGGKFFNTLENNHYDENSVQGVGVAATHDTASADPDTEWLQAATAGREEAPCCFFAVMTKVQSDEDWGATPADFTFADGIDIQQYWGWFECANPWFIVNCRDTSAIQPDAMLFSPASVMDSGPSQVR